MKNIVIVHGIGGIDREAYFPHLKKTCESLGLKVFMPSLGGYRNGITYNDWKDYFDKNILRYVNKDTIWVGQSLGTQFSVKYIAQNNLDIDMYISCAGPYDVTNFRIDAPERVLLFAPTAILFKPTQKEFDIFKQKVFEKYSLFCDNDIFFEQSNLEQYSKAINSIPILIKGKAHFGVEVLTELEDLIIKKAKDM